jgi:hypothetical protein
MFIINTMSESGYPNWADVSDDKRSLILVLADIFSTAVEGFGLIHAGKKARDRAYEVAMAQLGIQQARLLAWGDMVGIMDVSSSRDKSLDEAPNREIIEKALQSIIELHRSKKKDIQLQTYGLKSMFIPLFDLEVALDWARLESFRERFGLLIKGRRSENISGPHWIVTDLKKLRTFITEVRSHIDQLISLTESEIRVNQAIRADIRALGWHPAFYRQRATADGAKLQLIKEACKDWYPEYSAETTGALAYLNKEWTYSYQDAIEQAKARKVPDKDDPGALYKAKLEARVAEAASARQRQMTSYTNPAEERRASESSGSQSPSKAHRPKGFTLLAQLRPKSWRKREEEPEKSIRSMSFADAQTFDNMEANSLAEPKIFQNLVSERTFSEPATLTPEPPIVQETWDVNNMAPITSLISRHDKWVEHKS